MFTKHKLSIKKEVRKTEWLDTHFNTLVRILEELENVKAIYNSQPNNHIFRIDSIQDIDEKIAKISITLNKIRNLIHTRRK